MWRWLMLPVLYALIQTPYWWTPSHAVLSGVLFLGLIVLAGTLVALAIGRTDRLPEHEPRF